MKTLYFLLLTVTALAGCASSASKNEAPGPASRATGLTAAPQRIADGRIFADRRTIDSLQLRLRKLNESGVPQNNYPLAKAQCWLDTAVTQYEENDRSGYIEESLTESSKIITALEADKNAKAGYETPLVARSTRLRDDLWAQLSNFKANASALACNAHTVACAEIRLVRAGHAEQQTGWRAATPYVEMAEDGIRKAAQEAARCTPTVASPSPLPVPAPVAAASVPSTPQAAAPAAPPVMAPTTKESFVILSDALFQFGKSERSDMLPGGLQRLSAVAQRLKAFKSISNLTVIGHTDRLGSDPYNDALSLKRATTVLQYLESLGVKAGSAKATGVGKREPVTTACGKSLAHAQLIGCLQADRRVTIEVSGTAQ